MSSSYQKDGAAGGGGAYVPPHKRALHHPNEIPAKMPQQVSPTSSEKSQTQKLHSGRGGGDRPGGRSPPHSPTRNRNTHKKSHDTNSQDGKGRQSKSHSPTRSTNSNNSNHHHNQQQHRYHSPTRKEDLAIQKQQMKLIQDSLDRICCINLDRHPERWQSFQLHLYQSLGKKMGHTMAHHVERIPAVDGIPDHLTDVTTSWDATENAKWDHHIEPPMIKEMSGADVRRALSHINLWRELAAMPDPEEDGKRQANMLIMEDDALFYSPKLAMNKAAIVGSSSAGRNNTNHQHHDSHHLSIANHDFLTAFQLAWTQLPENWDIWYLGFSDRGDRLPVEDEFKLPKPKPHHHHLDHQHHHHHYPSMAVQIFSPTYGFHTHGYVLTAKAARTLLDNLPVVGPLDVWLADNKWFGLKIYCSVVEGEGWQKTGAWLITQNRKKTCSISPNPDSQLSGQARPGEL